MDGGDGGVDGGEAGEEGEEDEEVAPPAVAELDALDDPARLKTVTNEQNMSQKRQVS